MSRSDQMRLGAFLTATGQHAFAWKDPNVLADGAVNIEEYIRLVRKAEDAKFDMMFLADAPAVLRLDGYYSGAALFEPITLLSALSTATSRIGLVATVTSSFNAPYNIARMFASLDHLSHGRAGWNVVTSANPPEGFNYGFQGLPDAAERYRRAEEAVDLVNALWDSWEDDAFVRDRSTGVFFDKTKVHVQNHKGEFFDVRGPLNVPRSPQGRPVVVQAGSSEAGIELGARTAEVVFTAQTDIRAAQEFYATLKGRMAKFGRDPDELKIMPGFAPIVAETHAEAVEKAHALDELVDPVSAMAQLEYTYHQDLSAYDPEGPMPMLDLSGNSALVTRQAAMLKQAQEQNLTMLDVARLIANARGHNIVVGSPVEVADAMQEWFETRAADGFNVMPETLPGGLDDFIRLVMPILQERGQFRTEYSGTTLRENLGLPYPVNQYLAEPAAR